ncbi:MAG: hypothetical protein KGH88_01655 [Thaumarchaeota archaeon]|nr:hypothetical protein [Nitrososphaerota archaeon]
MALDKVTSFRLDNALLQKLSREATQKQISLNKLVNCILHEHTDLQSDISRNGFIGIRRTVLSKLLEETTDKKMIAIARHVANIEGKEILLILKNEFDSVSSLNWLDNWLKISGYQYKHDMINSDTHYYLIYHNMGYKWSVYLSHIWEIILKNLLRVQAEFELTEHTISFKID